MKLIWHTVMPSGSGGRLREVDPLWTLMRDHAEHVVAADTTVEFMFTNNGTSSLSHPYLVLANERALVVDALTAEREGVDGLMTAFAGDLGLDVLQSALQIPVVGSLQCALSVAGHVGRRAGVVTVHPGYIDQMEQAILRYGCRGRMVDNRPVRHWAMNWQDAVAKALSGDPEQLFAEFTTVAGELIDDGADVIVGGGQIFGALLWRYGVTTVGNSGVPVVDAGASGLKMLELLVSMRETVGLAKSEAAASPLRTLPPELFDAATGLLRVNDSAVEVRSAVS